MTALQYFVQKLNNTNADVQCAYTPKIIVALPPITPHITSAVRMPAPTLSPVVITICASCDESVLLSDPALASPELVPVPLTSLFHPGAWSTRLLCIASSTAICSPTPRLPSLAPVVHFSPHRVPVLPAVQVFTAAMADVSISSIILSCVQGASSAVAASSRIKYVLKER